MKFIHKNEFNVDIDGKPITYRKICFLTDKGYESYKCTIDLYKQNLSQGKDYKVYFDKFGRACEVI